MQPTAATAAALLRRAGQQLAPRLRYRVTGSAPCFLHGNGRGKNGPRVRHSVRQRRKCTRAVHPHSAREQCTREALYEPARQWEVCSGHAA